MRYYCECCCFGTNNKRDYARHLETLKHKHYQQNNPTIDFICDICDKKYKGRDGLWRHKQTKHGDQNNTVAVIPSNQSDEISHLTKLVTEVLKQNMELQNQLTEISKNQQCTTTITNNNNNNNNNTTFNLQLFLNETCKDAMNISDFVSLVSVTVEDLKKIGSLGYVNGMSELIMKHLKNIDINKRPMHCSDIKREIIYIREKDIWEKDTEQKQKLKRVVEEISKLNTRSVVKYQIAYPQSKYDIHSKEHNEFSEIIHEWFGGKETNMELQKQKVIKKIMKQIAISKNH